MEDILGVRVLLGKAAGPWVDAGVGCGGREGDKVVDVDARRAAGGGFADAGDGFFGAGDCSSGCGA